MDFIFEANKITLYDDNHKLLAEVTFPAIDENTVEINHTFVDESLRGQGIAQKLMEAAASQLKLQGKKAVLTCSYASAWFQKHQEYSDYVK